MGKGLYQALRSAVNRLDGWVNTATGQGTDRDRTQYTNFVSGEFLTHGLCTSLYNGSPLCAKIVNTPADEFFRRGYDISLSDERKNLKALIKASETLDLMQNIQEGVRWGLLYGGALLILGIDDGNPPDAPVDTSRIRGVSYARVVDRRRIFVSARYSNPQAPKYGEPALYSISSNYDLGGFTNIHASRCIRFGGEKTDQETQMRLDGWDLSVLQRPYDDIRAFSSGFQNVSTMLTDASQGVLLITGLIDQIAHDPETLQNRFRLTDLFRGVTRSLVLDKDGEDFKKVPTSFASIPETLDRFMYLVSAATGIPVTMLFGRSPAGMNATGDSDFRSYYDQLSSRQVREIVPKIREALSFLAYPLGIDPELIEIKPHPLWEMTDTERATCEKTEAERDQIYLSNDVWLPEEVAIARARGARTTAATSIDMPAREKSLKQELALLASGGDKGK